MHLSALALLSTLLSLVNAAPELVLGNITFRGVKEVVERQDIEVFRGIPYGKRKHAFRPVSAMDFGRGEPRSKDATKALFSCPQLGNFSIPPDANALKELLETLMKDGDTKENILECARIHVYRTKKAKKAKGIFYIHGGGMESGSPEANLNRVSGIFGHQGLQDKHGLVVFSVSYPLGPWSAALQVEEDTEDSDVEKVTIHNNALMDLLTALKMVQDNAKAFGVDLKKMVIIGHSAGAALAQKLQFALVKAKEYGLEDIAKHVKFILMGGMDAHFPSIPLTEALKRRDMLVNETICRREKGRRAQYNCLDKLDQETIVAAARKIQVIWGPIVDNDLLVGNTEKHLTEGLYLTNPTLTTMTMDEASLFTIRHLKTSEEEGMDVLKKLGQQKKAIKFMKKHYKDLPVRNSDLRNYEALTRGLTESFFVKTALELRELTKDRMEGNMHIHQFDFTYDALESFGARFALCMNSFACRLGVESLGGKQLEESAHYLRIMGLFHGIDQGILFNSRVNENMAVSNIVQKTTMNAALLPIFEFIKTGTFKERKLNTHVPASRLLKAPINTEAIVRAIFGNALGDAEIVEIDSRDKVKKVLETSTKRSSVPDQDSESSKDSHASENNEVSSGEADNSRGERSEKDHRQKSSRPSKKDKERTRKSEKDKEPTRKSEKKDKEPTKKKDKKDKESKNKTTKKQESQSLFGRLFSRGDRN